MKKLFVLIMLTSFVSCDQIELTDNERTILTQKYLEKFESTNEYLVKYGKLGLDTEEISTLIKSTTKHLRTDFNFNKSRNSIVQFLENNLYKQGIIDRTIEDAIQSKLDAFKNGELSYIEELFFVEQTFEFGYWIIWTCTSYTVYGSNYYKLDTLVLYENSDYTMKFGNYKLEDFKILENSLQADSPNEIKFTTKLINESPIKVHYTYKAENQFTGETPIFKDSIVIKLIKKD